MNDSYNGNFTGNQINNVVAEALQSGDHRNLNDLVIRKMSDTLSEAGVQITQETTFACKTRTQLQYGQREHFRQEIACKERPVQEQITYPQEQTTGQQNKSTQKKNKDSLSARLKKTGDGLIFLCKLFGATGFLSVIVTGLILLLEGILLTESGMDILLGLQIIIFLAIPCGGIFILGFSLEKCLKQENGKALKKNPKVETDKQKEISNMEEMINGQEAELNTMMTEGMECVRRLHDLNNKIPGEVISDKLYRLEKLLKEIFDNVRIHPEQMHRIHKLMDYYLPATLKLVEAYEEFDRVSMPGQEILSAKAEIENTLDTINEAFKEILNNLFRSIISDVTMEAHVLRSMLANEGITKGGEHAGELE